MYSEGLIKIIPTTIFKQIILVRITQGLGSHV